jgi:hypothetical protein
MQVRSIGSSSDSVFFTLGCTFSQADGVLEQRGHAVERPTLAWKVPHSVLQHKMSALTASPHDYADALGESRHQVPNREVVFGYDSLARKYEALNNAAISTHPPHSLSSALKTV